MKLIEAEDLQTSTQLCLATSLVVVVRVSLSFLFRFFFFFYFSPRHRYLASIPRAAPQFCGKTYA